MVSGFCDYIYRKIEVEMGGLTLYEETPSTKFMSSENEDNCRFWSWNLPDSVHGNPLGLNFFFLLSYSCSYVRLSTFLFVHLRSLLLNFVIECRCFPLTTFFFFFSLFYHSKQSALIIFLSLVKSRFFYIAFLFFSPSFFGKMNVKF